MPPSAVPLVAAIATAFAVFIIVVGGVSLWTSLPSRGASDSDAEV